MPETLGTRQVFTLQEVARSIQRTLMKRYGNIFWVKAEMNKLNHYPHTGHCYPELVEKQDGKVMAQLRANLWRTDYERINNIFLKVLKEPLKDGISIMFSATIQFDPVYGLALRIHDIDPSFSLGELEREKKATIERLQKEGFFDANKRLSLPVLPQRIAVISVETSKGYADFVKMIDGNNWGYRYFYMLFPALLQGEKAVVSIIEQLNRIRSVVSHFDAVAIIRGGGGDVGLSCYNHYELARTVATFPIPVISGIGHSTNETVVEMVSHTNAITPTELADFLIQKFHNFSVPLKEAVKLLQQAVPALIDSEISNFRTTTDRFRLAGRSAVSNAGRELAAQCRMLTVATSHRLQMQHAALIVFSETIHAGASAQLRNETRGIPALVQLLNRSLSAYLQKQNKDMEHASKSVALMDPVNVLKRGYSITTLNGKLLRSVAQADAGGEVETRLHDGVVKSRV